MVGVIDGRVMVVRDACHACIAEAGAEAVVMASAGAEGLSSGLIVGADWLLV
jgi:hypothetical protein